MTLSFFSISGAVTAQTIENKKASFSVVSNTSSQSSIYYIDALSEANMESYRLRTEDVKITFKEGVEVILISASKLVAQGENIDITKYQVNFPTNYSIPVFSVSTNGKLMAEYKTKRKYQKP